jgi:hypothetical protein
MLCDRLVCTAEPFRKSAQSALAGRMNFWSHTIHSKSRRSYECTGGQGVDAVPHVVQRCIESWQRHNPGWELRILDDTGLANTVDMSDFPDFLPRRVFADLLRTRLLKRYGGVWVDATVYCHRPLDDWLPLLAMTGCFTLDRPGPDRAFSSWFLASVLEHVLMCAWEETYGAYLRSLTHMQRRYFMFFYSLQWRLERDPTAMSAFLRKGGLQAPPTFLLMSALLGRTPVSVAIPRWPAAYLLASCHGRFR